jgi:drug/metabolite transporter (DMT)-like permease
MGVAFAFAAMVCFASNILFRALLFPFGLGLRAAAWSWSWQGAAMFAMGGVIGTFLGRRFLFDTVRILGPSRASAFRSTAPAFALLGALLVIAGIALLASR